MAKDYKIITAKSLGELETAVQPYVRQHGYEPVGCIVITEKKVDAYGGASTKYEYSQALYQNTQ